jgi:hypothetical protein
LNPDETEPSETIMTFKDTFSALALSAAFATGVLAAGDGHKHAAKETNGGQIIDTVDGHWELVAKGGELTVYVTDKDMKPVTTKPAKGTATVLVGGKTVKVDLTSAEPNLLKGTGDFVAAKGMKVIVALDNIGPKPEQVRFTPLD